MPTHATAPEPAHPRTSGRRSDPRAKGSWPVATSTSAAEPRAVTGTTARLVRLAYG
jgi:hypothetical protein